MSLFLADVLLNTGETAVSNIGIDFNFVLGLKIVLLLAFFVIILAVQNTLFKIIGFLMVIFGSLYKIFDLLAQVEFEINQFLDISPYVFIIVFSIYYLYRSNRKKNSYKKRKSSTKTEEEE
jgi:membrane-bound ClpP family serine protease